MQLLRSLIRECLLLEGKEEIKYNSMEDLLAKIDTKIWACFEKVRSDVKKSHPNLSKILDRTKFVPVYEGTPVPPGVLDEDDAYAQFVSKCDGLFSGTHLGIECRASGNNASPPTHNAMYLDVMLSLPLSDIPESGTFYWSHDDYICSIMSHEFSHAIDDLSQFNGDGKIEDVQEDVLLSLFDTDALEDIEVGKSNLSDRMKSAGSNEKDIETKVSNFSGTWEQVQSWLSKEYERAALAIQLATALDKAGMTGRDFIGSNLESIEGEIDESIISEDFITLMYGILSSDGIDGIESIKDAVL
jgi:hypothetical protein